MSNCKTISVCNQKGGVGKTTTTVNLGVGLAMQGKKVLLIDADPQGDLTTCLGWQDTDGLGITLATKLTDVINETMTDPMVGILHHEEGVDLVPANLELSAMEFNLVNAMSRETTLKNYLSQVKNRYDYVIIDCMPSLGMVTLNALSAADSVIIPVQAQYLPAKGMTQLVQTISKVKKYINPDIKIDGMLGSLVGLVIVAYLLLYLLISVGCIYPANYAEQKINEAYDTILRADKVTAEMIPALCDYVIFSENGEKIGGDLSEQYEQIAWNVAKYGNASGKYFYKVIVRENEYVVLQYRLTPQYHSAFLREHFIGPQNVMIIMSVIGAVAIIIIQSIRFGKRIKKQMQPVLDAIGQIKDQNLEYETSCSGIKEFDDCLSAIDDMRDALRESLEKQWKTEQEKKQQMSALAHDIKTPLTIVRGNAELLSETELTTEQKNNITYVLNGTTQIQSYVKQLIDVTKSWNCSDVTYTTVRLEDFFADIKEQALGLVEIYHQKIDWKAGQSDKKVTIAYDPMFRAVMNVIQNAVEHTKENGIIYIDAKEQDGRLTFIVEDSGSGFTKEALLHGTEQFFMDDTSRNGEAHYGMGLFFAKTVAEKYGGGIKLSNSENTGGARVEIFFLSSQETS